MKRPVFAHRSLLTAFGLGLLACLSAAGCSEDGVTPNCPSVRLYDVRALGNETGAAGAGGAAEQAAAIEQERLAAVDAGCQTDIDRTDAGATP